MTTIPTIAIPLLQYYQRQNVTISAKDWRNFTDRNDFYLLISELRNSGVPVLNNANGYRLKCTCRLVSGENTGDCYVHSAKLRVG